VRPERLKILVVVTLAETGGAQAYVRELTSVLVEAHEVTVAAHGSGPLVADVRAAGARFVSLRHVRRRISPFRDVLGLVELWRLCRTIRPSVVHVNSAKAGILGRLAARLAGVPVCVYTVHGWAFKVPGERSSILYRWAERILAPLTTLVICVSERERLAGLAARACRPERTVVIRNAVRVSAAPVRNHVSTMPVRLVSVGRLAPPKDFWTLIASMTELARGTATLDILGDGPQQALLVEQASVAGQESAISFLGNVNDVPRRLAAADVFVLSSQSEGLPISVLEAMAAGLPVVASDVGGMAELIEEGTTGFLVPSGDRMALARRLQELVDNHERRAMMGAAARQRALDLFDWPRWAEQHRLLYASLLDEETAATTGT
jgi:glycosyltransferase involved in cell wall biosynthesis